MELLDSVHSQQRETGCFALESTVCVWAIVVVEVEVEEVVVGSSR